MILDRLENAGRYGGMHPLFGRAFEFLRRTNLHTLVPGRNAVEGDRLYAVVMRGAGKGRQQAPLEAHRKYIDIQYTVSGSELIGWKHAAICQQGKGFDDKKDVELYADTPDAWVAVPAGAFAVFFPEDAHAPMAGEGNIQKVVMKVAV